MGLNATTITLGSIAIIALLVGLVLVIRIGQKNPDTQGFIINLVKAVRGEPRQIPFINIGLIERQKGKD